MSWSPVPRESASPQGEEDRRAVRRYWRPRRRREQLVEDILASHTRTLAALLTRLEALEGRLTDG